MKKILALLLTCSLVMTFSVYAYAGFTSAPRDGAAEDNIVSAEETTGDVGAPGDSAETPGDSAEAPGDSAEEPGGSEGESGGSEGESGGSESAAVEDDGIDAAITISDDGENKDREQTEGFTLDYYEGGKLDESGVSGFLFASEDPTVNFYFSELSDNKEAFFTIGGTGSHVTYEDLDASFSPLAVEWMDGIGVEAYDSAINLKDSGSEDTLEPVISAKGWTYLDIEGLLLYAEGNARSAVYSDVVGGSTVPGAGGGGGGGESQTPVVIIRDSLLETTGQSTARIDSAISVGNSGGRARGIQPQGKSLTYLYNSAIVSRTWGAFSTDSARQNLDLVAYNSLGYSSNGYGAYADTSCHLYLYGTSVIGSSDGITASNDGEIYAVDSSCALDSVQLRELMGKKASATVSATDYLEDSAGQELSCVIAGGSTAVQFHMPDQMHQGSKNTRKATLYMQGGTLRTDDAYITSELSAYNQRFSGSLIVTKSTQANVLLEGTAMESSTGVLIHSMINSDSNVNDIPDGEVAPGSDYVFRNMEAAGDIINDDYQRALRLTLDGTTLTGAIYSHTCEDWNAFSTAELEGEYILNPDGYETIWGVELTLQNGSVWNVTDTSILTGLTVGEDCVINGTVTENADGTITVEP